jgi:hypothetical protein
MNPTANLETLGRWLFDLIVWCAILIPMIRARRLRPGFVIAGILFALTKLVQP